MATPAEQLPQQAPGTRLPHDQVKARRERHAQADEFHPQSRPRMDREIRLNTDRAQHLLNRQFPVTNRALHYLTAVLPAVLAATQRSSTLDQQTLFNNVSDRIAEFFGRVNDAFDAEQQRLQAICAEHGLAIPEYTVPVVTEVPVSSRSANQLVELFARLDELLMRLDAIWIAGLHEDREHNLAHRHFYKMLYRLTNQVTDLARRARKCYRFGTVDLFPADEAPVEEDEDHPERHRQEFELEPDGTETAGVEIAKAVNA